MPVKATKTIQLWEGKEVAVEREELLKDFDYMRDLQEKIKTNDLGLVEQLFVLIGGEKTFNEVREHIIAEKGVFDYEELGKITEQLLELFPKASSSSSKRW